MRMTRRMFVGQAAAAVAAVKGFAAEAAAKVRVGACVLSLDEAKRGGGEGILIGEHQAADTLG
ncbi:MAG: hypothetical protein FWG50_06620, partial [Kiritimatiellaeota bacterium]|nr:hypothetical protein [Kiritimatiellota bacterium]